MADPIISNSYTGDGSTVLFSFTFPYITQEDVYVKVDKTLTTEYTFANVTTIEFDSAPANGAAIEIYRDTQTLDIENTFYPGSAIRAKDLNDNFTQSLYVIQEADLTVNDANQNADEALETANEALEKSEQALQESGEAKEDAAQAAEDAAQAAQDAADAAESAEKAEQAAQDAGDVGLLFDADPGDGSATSGSNKVPIKFPEGMQLPTEDSDYEEENAVRVNTVNEKLEIRLDGDWTTASAGAEVSLTPPTPATEGDVWWDPTDGRGYVYYKDTDSSQWVEMNPSWNGNIADNVVTTDKILDGAVTPDKLDREYLEPGEEAITRIIGGENVTVDPSSGKGVVTINAPASGGGGGTVINYNGASAWGNIASDATLNNGFNVTDAGVTRVSQGVYKVNFETALSGPDYSVQATSIEGDRLFVEAYAPSATEVFFYCISPEGVNTDGSFTFATFSSNAIAPPSGVGADAWVCGAANGSTEGEYNIKKVTFTAPNKYAYEFSTPMPTGNYAINAQAYNGDSQEASAIVVGQNKDGFELITIVNGNGIGSRHYATVHASSTVTPTYTWTRDGTTVRTANSGDDVNVDGNITTLGYLRSNPVPGAGNYVEVDYDNGIQIVNTNITKTELKKDGSAKYLGKIDIGDSSNVLTTANALAAQSSTDSSSTNGTIYARQWSSAGRNYVGVDKNGAVTFEVKSDGTSTFSNALIRLDPEDSTKVLDVKESIRTMQSALYRLKAAVLIPDTSVDQLRLRILEALETITEEVD